MSSFMSSMEYDITSEAEVAGILSHFDTDEILGLIDDSLQRKHMFYPNNPLNLVVSLETNFSMAYSRLPAEKERIDELRDNTYLAIIDKLCSYYNCEYNIVNQDLYTVTFYLYDFLISSFSTNVVKFFTNYIIKEKDYLYNHVGLIEMKKNKDMSTIYTKRVHRDSKLAAISANLEYVIDSISLFDISLQDILDLLYPDKNIAEFISMSIAPKGNMFRDHFVTTINNEFKPVFLTNVKFTLMDQDSTNLSPETIKFIQGE